MYKIINYDHPLGHTKTGMPDFNHSPLNVIVEMSAVNLDQNLQVLSSFLQVLSSLTVNVRKLQALSCVYLCNLLMFTVKL